MLISRILCPRFDFFGIFSSMESACEIPGYAGNRLESMSLSRHDRIHYRSLDTDRVANGLAREH